MVEHFKTYRTWGGVALVCGLISGCSNSVAAPNWPDPVPYTGTVTLDNDPLTDTQVIFIPDVSTQGQGGSGRTDSNGDFTVTSSNGRGGTADGLIPGQYKVFFSRMVKPDGEVWTPDPESNSGPATFGAKEQLPPKYSDPAKSKYLIDVDDGGGSMTFELKKK